MARRRGINDIDEDEEGQIVDYSRDSDIGDKPTEILWHYHDDGVHWELSEYGRCLVNRSEWH